MLVIRFARRGRSNAPFYDIVLAEKSRPVKKKFITKIGYFNPLANGGEGELSYDKDLTIKYINNGAQLSQAVARLLTKDGLKEAGKFIVARHTKPKKEAPKPSADAEAVADKEPKEDVSDEAESTDEAKAEAPKEEAPAEAPKAEEPAPEAEAPAEEAPAADDAEKTE